MPFHTGCALHFKENEVNVGAFSLCKKKPTHAHLFMFTIHYFYSSHFQHPIEK
jgi:hypothetical protein